MNAGTLRHHVTLFGPDADTPLVPPDWWCAVQESTGTTIITGRFHPGITTATRLHHKGRIYQVDTIANRDDRDVELTLTCREVFD
jgi:metal-dependent hydrolase (beta-lactamase superfamily II)